MQGSDPFESGLPGNWACRSADSVSADSQDSALLCFCSKCTNLDCGSVTNVKLFNVNFVNEQLKFFQYPQGQILVQECPKTIAGPSGASRKDHSLGHHLKQFDSEQTLRRSCIGCRCQDRMSRDPFGYRASFSRQLSRLVYGLIPILICLMGKLKWSFPDNFC